MSKKNIIPTIFLMVFISCGGFQAWNNTSSYDKAKFIGNSTNIIYDNLMQQLTANIKVLVDKYENQGTLTPVEYKELRELRSVVKDKLGGYFYVNKAYLIAMKKWDETGKEPSNMNVILSSLKDYADLFAQISDRYNLFNQ